MTPSVAPPALTSMPARWRPLEPRRHLPVGVGLHVPVPLAGALDRSSHVVVLGRGGQVHVVQGVLGVLGVLGEERVGEGVLGSGGVRFPGLGRRGRGPCKWSRPHTDGLASYCSRIAVVTFQALHVVEPEVGVPLQGPADGVKVKVALPEHHVYTWVVYGAELSGQTDVGSGGTSCA